MREARSGHVVAISSSAGLSGFEFGSAYAASKFGLEGFMESLAAEIAPFGITTTIVNPGFFRTELLTEQSTRFAETTIHDYDERRAMQLAFWKSQNGKQGGDPAKLARALVALITDRKDVPLRFIAGADNRINRKEGGHLAAANCGVSRPLEFIGVRRDPCLVYRVGAPAAALAESGPSDTLNQPMDVLADVLSIARTGATVVAHAEQMAPWGLEID